MSVYVPYKSSHCCNNRKCGLTIKSPDEMNLKEQMINELNKQIISHTSNVEKIKLRIEVIYKDLCILRNKLKEEREKLDLATKRKQGIHACYCF